MPTEVEAKFLAAPEAIRALASMPSLGRAELGPSRQVDEVDRYLDTSDGRLAAVRWACRLRRRGERWTVSLKGPPRPDRDGTPDWFHARPELEGPATADCDPGPWPASPARTRLLELTGGAALAERVRLVQRRAERAVTLGTARLGTLSLDEVSVEGRLGHAGAFGAVELELVSERSDADIDEPARILAAMAGLTPDPLSKLEHALALLER
jgi:inorganic triphosphatase YgiF